MEEFQEKQIDIREYLRVLIKRRWTIVALFTIVFLSVAFHIYTTTPIFRATARIVIEKENPNIVSIQEVMAVDSTGSGYYQTQYKIIESRNVAKEVIRRLNLESSPEFFPPPKDDIISNTKRWFRETLSFWEESAEDLIHTGVAEKNNSLIGNKDMESEAEPSPGLVNSFIRRIAVEPISNSRLVDVSIDAADPVLAARMSNALVRAYIDKNLETKLNATKDAVKWLSERIEEEREKVEEAENNLLRYKEKQGIFTGFSSDAEQITAEKLAQLSVKVIDAEALRVEAETRYLQAVSLANTPDMLDSIPEVLTNDLVKDIKKMEVNLYNRMSELSNKYGRKHPQMVAIESELEELQNRKAKEVKRVVSSLSNEYKLTVAREESLKKALAQQNNESLEFNKKAIQYGVLQRQVESSRNMYDLLVKRFKETSLTEEMKTGNIRIIDEAEIPEKPVKPNKKRSLMLAIVVGLGLGVGLAFFFEYLDNTIKLPDEIKEHLKIPYLGPVPVFTQDESQDGISPELVTVHSPKSTASESFRGIRTGILFSSADAAPQVILVTSAGPSEGKTSCSANLAVAMANAGSRVLLLDCDMRRPRTHKIFQKQRENGITNVLVGNSELKDAIIPTDIKNLDLLPVGPIPPNPSEILGSKKMSRLLETLRKNYTRIIIDSPPITAVTDSVVLAPAVDGVIIIVRAGDTPRQVVQNGLDQLRAVNARILGAVLNGVSTSRDSYYYYQYYYYYYGEDGHKNKKTPRRKRRQSKAYS